MFPVVKLRIGAVVLAGITLLVVQAVHAQLELPLLGQEVIESRLEDFSAGNSEREARLKKLFEDSGCKDDKLSEQPLKGKTPPNLICVLPGKSHAVILVGAHFDKVAAGDGVVDNWSGASLLPSLFQSLAGRPHQHSFVLVGFTEEEKGLVGSKFYLRHLTPLQRSRIKAMVNLDTLGLGPSEVWASHSDESLLSDLAAVARKMKLPLTEVNVEEVGTADSESFAQYKIPRITIHSVTPETWPILHSDRDRLSEIHMDDYYATYRLLAAYLNYLDAFLEKFHSLETPEAAH